MSAVHFKLISNPGECMRWLWEGAGDMAGMAVTIVAGDVDEGPFFAYSERPRLRAHGATRMQALGALLTEADLEHFDPANDNGDAQALCVALDAVVSFEDPRRETG